MINYEFLKNEIKGEINITKNGFYDVSTRYSQTLTTERNLVNLLTKDLSKEIIDQLSNKLMIYKSYLVEVILILLKIISFFFSENIGLLNEFKNKIKSLNKSKEILVFSQSEILKNENNFLVA